MKKIVILLILLAPFMVNAQQSGRYIDISDNINERLRGIVVDSINDVSHYSLVKNFKSANIVYTTKDSINVIRLYLNYMPEHFKSPIVVADSIEQSIRAVHLPLRRLSEMLISTDSGKFTFATSNNEYRDWCKFTSYNYITTSPIIYIHNNRLQNNKLIAYFFGDGDLTQSDSIGKSMMFMISSNDGGASWSNPQIALKHNLYSLNNASIAMYSSRNNKKGKLYMICSSKETKSLFLSTSSNDGASWSYPMELPYLNNTDNHVLSISKNKVSILFTESNMEVEDEFGDIFLIITSINDIKNQKMKGIRYKIHNYSKEEAAQMYRHHKLNHAMGGMLYKPRRLMFTISSPLKADSPSSIKAAVINVSKKNSKIL